MATGRPTDYDPSFCDKTYSLGNVKIIKFPVVYGLCNNGKDDVFYIGSTTKPSARFNQYRKGLAHGNALLSERLKEPFNIYIYDVLPDDIRSVEIEFIKSSKNSLLNIVRGNWYKGCMTWPTTVFLRKYENMFSNPEAVDYATKLRAYIKSVGTEERIAIEYRFLEMIR